MITERANLAKNQNKKPIIILIILFFAVVFLRPAKTDYPIIYVIISLILLTAIAYLIIYKYLVYYTYQLTENELVIIKNIGSHEKYLMIAPIKDVLVIAKCGSDAVSGYKNINYPVGDDLVGAYTYQNKTRTFSISPSEEFIQKLKLSLGDKILL